MDRQFRQILRFALTALSKPEPLTIREAAMPRRPLPVITTFCADVLVLVPVVVPLLVWTCAQDDGQWWLPPRATPAELPATVVDGG
jgi:hypothetical protein